MSSASSKSGAPRYADWRRRVEEELGEASFEEALVSRSPRGVVRQPLYTGEDLPGEDPAGFPGVAPFTRGRRTTPGLCIAQEIVVRDAAAGQAALLSGLAAGVGLVYLALTDTLSEEDAATLLDGVDLRRLHFILEGSGAAASVAPFVGAAERLGFPAEELHGGFGGDPLGADGTEPTTAEALAESRRRFPGMRALTVDKRNFLKRISEDPSLAFRLVKLMSRKLRETSDEVARLQSAERPKN